jgi:hypothetical protein
MTTRGVHCLCISAEISQICRVGESHKQSLATFMSTGRCCYAADEAICTACMRSHCASCIRAVQLQVIQQSQAYPMLGNHSVMFPEAHTCPWPQMQVRRLATSHPSTAFSATAGVSRDILMPGRTKAMLQW